MIRRFSLACYLFGLHFLLHCQGPSLGNPCDPKGDQFFPILGSLFLSGNETPFCGTALEITAPSFLQCPSPLPVVNGLPFQELLQTDGTFLQYSVSPAFPSGVGFLPLTNAVGGTYSGWQANRTSFTITVSNQKGSASCSYTPQWMGVPPVRTRLTQCYDNTGTNVPCSVNPGQDGALQKGMIQTLAGPTIAGTGPGLGQITTDFSTGRVWTSCSWGATGSGCADTSATNMDLTTANANCASLNSSQYGGLSNWRVPYFEEYITTLDFSVNSPSIPSAFFPNTTIFNYKSQSIRGGAAYYPTYISSTWGIGNVSDPHFLRCVAAPPIATTKAYRDLGDGTVLDLDTSLVWTKCVPNQTGTTSCTGIYAVVNWSSAINNCNTLNLAGRTWRLPNIQELLSLVDWYYAAAPSLDSTVFPNTPAVAFWSSTTRIGSPTNAATINFATADSLDVDKSTASNYRCVSDY